MWIKATLKEKGFKLKDMAEALGIPAPRVTDILRGTREVQSDELENLSSLLDINLRSLLASLDAGELTRVAAADGRLPVSGLLMGDGSLAEIPSEGGPSHIALPPDAVTDEGLSCYIMGDSSMAQEVRAGDIMIAADPRIHFQPIVPGGLFLVRVGAEKLALRQLVASDSGETWLVPLPEQPDPKLASWRFSMLPASLKEGAGATADTAPDTDREIPAGSTVSTDHIAAAVLWVHRRYRPQADA